ncbi:SGNH/GDSL hydrolase family protein [Streptomyces longwoodensis]|uniref:SGNH/GDSL hydrolase family protein n=1 Tax=Streptomyces longwoodensis TaxID=68231 RepID=UPI00379A854C
MLRASKPARAGLAGVAACAVLTGLIHTTPAYAQAAAKPVPTPLDKQPADAPSRVADPATKLGKDWNTSRDRAVTAAADTDGLKVLVADSAKAYEWKTAAVLTETGLPADSWIGNQCVMDRDHTAVTYAPRSFTNKPNLMQGGAFTAIVNLATGTVTKLPFTGSLAYFDPTCNTGTHTAAFTAYRDMNDPARTKTRIVTVNTSGQAVNDVAVQGEVTSAVPVNDGAIAARGRKLIHITHSGTVKTLVEGDSVPLDIHPTARGHIAFIDRQGEGIAHAKLFRGQDSPEVIASGKPGELELHPGEASRVFLTGHPISTPRTQGTGVTSIDAPTGTDISSHGRLAVDTVLTPGIRAGLAHIKSAGRNFTKSESSARGYSAQSPATMAEDVPVTVTSTATSTGERITQSVQNLTAPSGRDSSPALTSSNPSGAQPQRMPTAADVSHDPTDSDRWCSISRNDLNAQALQPTPNQVEWAVDMAVRGELRAKWIRQGGYRSQTGMATVDPQGLFPPPTLKGGGRIPANVMLGVMAQESNLWQAEPGSIPGQMGSPLAATDGYYGRKSADDDPDAYWQIHWDKSDCGYGVGQITDGMRLAGHEKDKETSLSPALQKAVAVDYTTNIAAAVQILADKWNEVHTPGQTVTVNNDDPSRVENWFTAVWNYNLGFNKTSDANTNGGHWGLGWYNNPANPFYAKGGWDHPFMDTSINSNNIKDAAHPQDWPYEEKVMGWSAWSIDTGFSYSTSGRQDWPGETGFSSAGFYPAWWTTSLERSEVSPPLSTFCNSLNGCDPDIPPHCPDETCYQQYWWNQAKAIWKPDCDSSCGHEHIKYETLVAEPGRGYRLQDGQPVCSGAPAGAHVVASVPNGTQSWGDCGPITSPGTFQFTFYPDAYGNYEAKEDLHQVGGGYGGHFWYAHTRNTSHLGGAGGRMTITGTWTLGQNLNWARVLVHLPDTGAHTRQAAYTVGGADTTSTTRLVSQRADRWVSLGAFHFTGTPKVTLSNVTEDGTADEDIAWGAVAFQPLPGKPKVSMVAMGDSFSSGEGASEGDRDYYPETNYRDKKNEKTRNACHRSKLAWSRQAALPGMNQSVAAADDAWSPDMDYHMVACSGARTYNVRFQKQSSAGELPQLQQGYLDQNTSLVTISIGGNDSRFGYVITECMKPGDPCSTKNFNDRDGTVPDGPYQGRPMAEAIPDLISGVVGPDIQKTLEDIHAQAPNARIVLMGYPPLLSNGAGCLNQLPGTIGISPEEAEWLNGVADYLAREMFDVTYVLRNEGIDAGYANPQAFFYGKAICGNPETIHGIVTDLTKSDEPKIDWPFFTIGLSAQSFHPKIAGARLYADALEEALGSWPRS